MRKLLKHLRTHLRECVCAPLFKLCEAALDLIVPLVIASLIDNGIAGGERDYVIRMCLLLLGLGVAGLAFSITAQYFAAKAAVGFSARVRHLLYEKIQGFGYSNLDTLGTSTIITRMTSDVNQLQSGVNLALRLLLRSPFIVFGAMVMAFTIDTPSALIFVGVIVLLSLVVFGIMLWSIPRHKTVQKKLDALTGAIRENLTGTRVVRAFTREQEEIDSFAQKNDSLSGLQQFVGRVTAAMNPVTYVLINLAVIVLISTGALRVETGILTQGAVVALYNYMSQILVELVKLANLIISITKAVACGNRIQAVLDMESTMRDGGGAKENRGAEETIRLENVSLTYDGAGAESLYGISMTVRRGQTVGIIGGTGSGKTSLVNLIPRFYDATSGRVLVDGADVKDYELKTLRGKVGIVPQKAILFAGTIRENLLWGNENATEEELLSAIRAAQAEDVIAAKGGLDAKVEQGGKNLSGGQRQRLTVARALVRKPEILILDDSASALDFATEARLRRAISALPFHPTVLIVSQRTSSLRGADAIAVLEDGRLCGFGTHDELLASCDVYREIHESQFRKEDAR